MTGLFNIRPGLIVLLVCTLLLGGCGDPVARGRAVYMLMDTSGTYTNQLQKAQMIISYLLGTLDSGDSLAVARIDSGSFSEKDIVAKVTFDSRPSVATSQKRAFRNQVDDFVKTVKGSPYTDISGGMLQAAEFLDETGAGDRRILIFSDMKEEIQKGHKRDFELPMDGIEVVALNVTKLSSDNIDPRKYLERLDDWNKRVVSGGGTWRVINDLDHVESILDDTEG
jgi:hypothetical protein